MDNITNIYTTIGFIVRDLVYTLMTDYPTLVIFLHAISAVVWVGGLVAMSFISYNTSQELSIEGRFENRSSVIRSYFLFLSPFITISLITALLMAFGYLDNAYDPDGFIVDMHNVDAFKLIKLKGSIWGVMVLDMFLILYTIRNVKCGRSSDKASTDCMWLVNTYLIPIAIFLGTINIFIGAFLRNLY